MRQVYFTPPQDSLGRTAPLHTEIRFPLMGIPVHVLSNSADVIEIAQRRFGRWSSLAANDVDSVAPRIVKIIVQPMDEARGENPGMPRAPFTYRFHSDTFLATDGTHLLTAQTRSGEALAFVTPQLVLDGDFFYHAVLECLALQVLMRRDRNALHAAAVVSHGGAVLLFGPSGVGKSTLCYACLRAGFQLLDEDAVYVSLRQGLRIWGKSEAIHLLPDASRHFPELESIPVKYQPNGKLKRRIPLQPHQLCFYSDRIAVCVLDRHAQRESVLEPLDGGSLSERITTNLESGFDLNPRLGAVCQALAERACYRLIVGYDLDYTVSLLMDLVGS